MEGQEDRNHVLEGFSSELRLLIPDKMSEVAMTQRLKAHLPQEGGSGWLTLVLQQVEPRLLRKLQGDEEQ